MQPADAVSDCCIFARTPSNTYEVQARLRDDLNRLPDTHFYACIESIVIARDEGAAQHTDPDYDLNLEVLDPPCLRALQVRCLTFTRQASCHFSGRHGPGLPNQ